MKETSKDENIEQTNDDDLPSYEEVQIDEDQVVQEAHDFVDKYRQKSAEEDTMMGIPSGDVEVPESFEVAAHKYNIEAEVDPKQKHDFGPNCAFYGRHVVNSNTPRSSNFRNLMIFDVVNVYDKIPTRRQECNTKRQRVTSEYQMCRSNPEVGGFDRKLQRAVIKREDVDVRQKIDDGSKRVKKSGGLLGFLGKKK